MRIAVSAETNQGADSQVAHHFGRCPFFALVDVSGEAIQSITIIENPFFTSHQPGQVPEFIKGQNAEVMISGGMGRMAIQFFDQFAIKPVTGASGTVAETVACYLEGKITSASSCAESEAHAHGDHNHDH